MEKQKKIYVISECGIFIAMAIALSYLEIPVSALGGSISFVMVPLFIICYRNGALFGIASGLIFGLLNCILSGKVGYGLPSILLDYCLAYGACGVAGIFKGKRAFIEVSVILGCIARFAVHFISGVTIYRIAAPTAIETVGKVFSSPVIYSLVYNSTFMLPDTVIAVAVMALLRVPLKKLDSLKLN